MVNYNCMDEDRALIDRWQNATEAIDEMLEILSDICRQNPGMKPPEIELIQALSNTAMDAHRLLTNTPRLSDEAEILHEKLFDIARSSTSTRPPERAK